MNKVVWLDRGFYPPYIGFCPNEKAWKYHLKYYDIDKKDEPYPTTDARVTSFTNLPKSQSRLMLIVTVGDHIDKSCRSDKMGITLLLVHEAVHIWQLIKDDIGEKSPGHEQEAYAIQSISSGLIKAYSQTRIKLA